VLRSVRSANTPTDSGDENTVAPSTAPEAMASEKTTPSLRSASNGTEHPVDTAVTATDEDQASGGVSTSPSSNPGVGDENTASSPTSTGVSAKEETTPSPLYAGGNTARLLDKAEKSATAIVDEGMCVRAAATAAAAVQAAAAAAPSADGLRANPDVARSPMFSATTLSAERLSIVSASEDLTEDTDVGPSAAVDETQLTSRTDRSDETNNEYGAPRRYQLHGRYRYHKQRGDERNDETVVITEILFDHETRPYCTVRFTSDGTERYSCLSYLHPIRQEKLYEDYVAETSQQIEALQKQMLDTIVDQQRCLTTEWNELATKAMEDLAVSTKESKNMMESLKQEQKETQEAYETLKHDVETGNDHLFDKVYDNVGQQISDLGDMVIEDVTDAVAGTTVQELKDLTQQLLTKVEALEQETEGLRQLLKEKPSDKPAPFMTPTEEEENFIASHVEVCEVTERSDFC